MIASLAATRYTSVLLPLAIRSVVVYIYFFLQCMSVNVVDEWMMASHTYVLGVYQSLENMDTRCHGCVNVFLSQALLLPVHVHG